MGRFRKAEPVTGEKCPRPGCGVGVQRTPEGTQLDGFRAHYRVVHPDVTLPEVQEGERGTDLPPKGGK